jgi:hypothetical protein
MKDVDLLFERVKCIFILRVPRILSVKKSRYGYLSIYVLTEPPSDQRKLKTLELPIKTLRRDLWEEFLSMPARLQ